MKPIQTGICLALAALAIPVISNAQGTNNINNKKEFTMSVVQKNKEVVRKLYEESVNQRNMEMLSDLISEDCVGAQGMKGAAGFEAPILPLIKACPDAQWKIQDLIGEGDKVMVSWIWKGTQTGPYTNRPATGKTISNGGMAVFEFKDGRISGWQIQTDRLGALQQLEVLPADLTALPNKKAHPGQVSFIDKFFVPAAARKEFYERMSINRNIINKLPGFIGDEAYEYSDDNGNLVCITVAQWESREAISKAREAVQAEYKKQRFDMAEMTRRLNITVDRGLYTEVTEH